MKRQVGQPCPFGEVAVRAIGSSTTECHSILLSSADEIMTTTAGFIFDMDGTLLDNTRFHTQSWLEVLADLGIPISAKDLHRHAAGKTTREVLGSIFSQQLSEVQILDYSERKERIYRELCRPHLKPLEGLISFLLESRNRGIPMAVATSAREGNIEFVLNGLDLKSFFQVIVGAGEVQHSKPHPEMFRTAAARLGVAPPHCLVFEDSLAGIEAAHRAGMRTVVVATSLQAGEVMGLPSVILAIDDFSALTPASLLEPQ